MRLKQRETANSTITTRLNETIETPSTKLLFNKHHLQVRKLLLSKAWIFKLIDKISLQSFSIFL